MKTTKRSKSVTEVPSVVRVRNVIVSYPNWIPSFAKPTQEALADLRSRG